MHYFEFLNFENYDFLDEKYVSIQDENHEISPRLGP